MGLRLASGVPPKVQIVRILSSPILLEGVHPKVVQEQLGQRTIQLPLDTYSHILPNMGCEVAAKRMSLFG